MPVDIGLDVGTDTDWGLIGLYVFVGAILVRDVRARSDSPVPVRSSVVGLVGCASLALAGAVGPQGVILAGVATALLVWSVASHLATRGWRSEPKSN